ncbi:MAG: hypothetical protein CMJ70_18510 [Planctomycetaceae bacterium]|nr:hypothetical protein [Planctomycetaceae bacterium]HAA71380.1 hypothetical protein [Planctomycetaceae bacterium]
MCSAGNFSPAQAICNVPYTAGIAPARHRSKAAFTAATNVTVINALGKKMIRYKKNISQISRGLDFGRLLPSQMTPYLEHCQTP